MAGQAEALRALQRAEAKHTAARADMLAAFAARAGHEDDGQGSVQAWLCWQTRITRTATASASAWTRRLGAGLIAVHRWGWTLRLNPDGTTTATSPDARTLHSHGPRPRPPERRRAATPAGTG